jgi:8-oxo-dGTP pyrophosphatase MutT (NUDIX family)
VASRGGRSLSLITFADVAWNAPFYESLGFEIVEPPARLLPLLERETAAGLPRGGRRVTMLREISPGVQPRPAVSVIPFRDGDRGLEVFVQHRVHTMDFAPGVVVFPGGRIDPVDVENAPVLADELVDELVEVWAESAYVLAADDPRLAVRVLLAAATREVAEETGVELATEELLPWDDWTTPPGFPKRFQVHFMAAHLPATDPRAPVNTTTEALMSEWLPVTEILDRGRGGDLQVMTPTRVILQELASLGSADAIRNAHPAPVPVHMDRTGRRPRPSRHG